MAQTAPYGFVEIKTRKANPAPLAAFEVRWFGVACGQLAIRAYRLRMRARCIVLNVALLIGGGLVWSVEGHADSQSDLRPGETIVVLPTEPHQWRKDPDCYVSRNAFDPNNTLQPQAAALKWLKRHRYSGYIFTNFEGWTFASAKRNENPRHLGERRFYATAYYAGNRIAFAPEPRTYWANFIGREALCNSQRATDLKFDAPLSPNLVIVDSVQTLNRVR